MRPLVLSTCLFACLMFVSCAAPPQSGTYGYSGNAIPAHVRLQPDGSFVARASSFRQIKPGEARQAAIHQLIADARSHGYSHYRLDGMEAVESAGIHVMMTGRLYRQGEAPRDAMPLESVGSGVIMVAETPIGSENPSSSVHRPIALEQQSAVSDNGPIVIEAPDFATE